MKREDVAHLATLARIELSETELTKLEGELSSIVSYVSTITDIAGDDSDTAPILGARFNVFKEDVVTNQADEYTEDMLVQMPARDGRYMKVKKILGGTE